MLTLLGKEHFEAKNRLTMYILRSWREQKIMLKRRYATLNDEDFVYEEGNREGMLKKLAAKLSKSMAELEFLFAELQQY